MSGFSEGAPCWADVSLPDLAAGQRFYGELLGWTFQDQGEEFGHYTIAQRDGRAAAALMGRMNPDLPAAWGLHLATSDAGKAAARIREAGGQILFGPHQVGATGVMVGAIDPGGSFVGVWQPGTHRGFGIVNEPGGFCWTENITREPAAVDDFYEKAFGCTTQQIGDGEHSDYAVYSLPGVPGPVSGRIKRSADEPADAPSGYQVYFAVEDCDAAAETVGRLGGQVHRGPQDSPFGRTAIVSDDQGVGFAIIDLSRTAGEPPAL
ncbi:VOC family protein [Streptomyces sp. NBC_01476]|uniref:VOC family protein n=1 Tax=Streptomyces sp. NBC_01476 TaxID=2903881 RepID=UPI002E332266|nr:VOC family protein [Streptomyces sp. NBC_01476]